MNKPYYITKDNPNKKVYINIDMNDSGLDLAYLNILELYLPSNYNIIEYVFLWGNNLTTLYIPDGVIAINCNGNNNLKEIRIPKSLTRLILPHNTVITNFDEISENVSNCNIEFRYELLK